MTPDSEDDIPREDEAEPSAGPPPATWAARQARKAAKTPELDADAAAEQEDEGSPEDQGAGDEPDRENPPEAEAEADDLEEEGDEEEEGDYLVEGEGAVDEEDEDVGEEDEEDEEDDDVGDEEDEDEHEEDVLGEEDDDLDEEDDDVGDGDVEDEGDGDEDEDEDQDEEGENEGDEDDADEELEDEQDVEDAAEVATMAPPVPPAPAAPLDGPAEPGQATPAEGALPPGMVLPGTYQAYQHIDEEDLRPAGHSLWKRFLAATVLVVASMAVATSASLLLYLSDIAQGLGRGEDLSGVVPQLHNVGGGDPQTILIIGSDQRWGDKKAGIPARSDTVILLRLDPVKGAIALFSLPRDLKVNIPGHGPNKLNQAFALGGPKLTLKVVKQLTGLEIHHLVNVNFRGFQRAVNAIDCVYLDVDRRYFNSNLGKAAANQYAEIDLKPGYQKLCGSDALDYVRYRHTDNDLVRAARQQNFLRQARQKIGPNRLLGDRKKLLQIFTRYTTSDIDDAPTMLEVLKLFLASREAPVNEVHFKGDLGESYVTSSEKQIGTAVESFLGTRATKGPRGKLDAPRRKKKRKPKPKSRGGSGLLNVSAVARQHADAAQAKLYFPVYYPKRLPAGATFVDTPRTYDLHDPDRRKHRAYKMVMRTYEGEYFGVMGTDWRKPPILDNPSEVRKIGNRTYRLYNDGDRLRMVAWKTQRGVYWISNSLLQTISKQRMLEIAKSMGAAMP